MSREKVRRCRLGYFDKSWCGLFFVQWLLEQCWRLWRWSNADGYRTRWPRRPAFILSKPGMWPFRTQADDYLKKNELYMSTQLPDGSLCITTLRGGTLVLERDGRLAKESRSSLKKA